MSGTTLQRLWQRLSSALRLSRNDYLPFAKDYRNVSPGSVPPAALPKDEKHEFDIRYFKRDPIYREKAVVIDAQAKVREITNKAVPSAMLEQQGPLINGRPAHLPHYCWYSQEEAYLKYLDENDLPVTLGIPFRQVAVPWGADPRDFDVKKWSAHQSQKTRESIDQLRVEQQVQRAQEISREASAQAPAGSQTQAKAV